MDAIEESKAWLTEANALSKDGQPDRTILGTDDLEIALRAIDYISRIKRTLPQQTDKNLISIAVDDMKVLTGLMKLVVAYGIYPLLPENVMIPLAPRVPNWTLPSKQSTLESKQLKKNLMLLSERIKTLFDGDDDITSLLLISPFVVDLLALTSFAGRKEFEFLVSKLPTFNAYKFLIQLRSASSMTPPLVATTLSELVIKRRDSVRTLIELILETSDDDLQDLSKATLALISVPKEVNTKQYIERLGGQLFDILSAVGLPSSEDANNISDEKTITNSALIGGSLIIVNEISMRQPRLLGRLRDLIITPFLKPKKDFPASNLSKSAIALRRMLQKGGHFADHLASRLTVSLWLLICTAASKSSTVDKFIMTLIVACLHHDPQNIILLVKNLIIRQLPPNFEWVVSTGKEPQLVESVSAEPNSSLVKQIDERLTILASVSAHLADLTTTRMLITLMRQWITPIDKLNQLHNAMEKLLIAKTIERLSSDDKIKKKLFNNPVEIIEFVFSIIESRSTEAISLSSTTIPISSLTNSTLASLDIGDSDDEDVNDAQDEEAVGRGENTGDKAEDDTILEISLNLLGSILMELTAESNFVISEERKSKLKALVSNKALTKTIRARADFCYELLNGAARINDDESDLATDEGAKKAAYDALKEPLIPSRAYGIHLMTKLLERGTVKLPEAMAVFEESLGDDDSYIYLNGIKAIEQAVNLYPASEVIDFLIPMISSSSNSGLDTLLRAREAVVRVLTPNAMAAVSSKLIDSLIQDLRASAKLIRDVRIRMSSASILGIVVAQFPLSVSNFQQEEAADCALGIITHERADADVALIRSAVVLALEIVNASNEGTFTNVNGSTLSRLIATIGEVVNETSDDTLKELAQGVVEASKLSIN